jgi:hypothetical protein
MNSQRHAPDLSVILSTRLEGLYPPPTEPQLSKILWHAHPSDYAKYLQSGIGRQLFVADHALTFLLSRIMEKALVNMPHKAEQAVEFTRDERLMFWFKACVECGAKPLPAVRVMGEHAAAGFGRLIQMKAYETLSWWKEQGVEGQFPGPHSLGGEPTNFATLAFVYGCPEAIDVLLPGTQLTHLDKLWQVMWTNRCADQSNKLIKYLWAQGAPPIDALNGLAMSRLNKKNISQVLATAQSMIDAGCLPVAPKGKLSSLAMAITNMTSPAVEQLVEFLLANGADPMEKTVMPWSDENQPHQEAKPVELVLERVMKLAPNSHLTAAAWRCFTRIATACDRQALFELYPPERQAQLIEELRRKQPANSPHGSVPDQGLAILQQLWLDISVVPFSGKAQARPRL